MFGRFAEPRLGRPVVADNRPGAGGILGTEAAKQSAPDGYTFLISTNSTHAANLYLYRHLPYDPARDFDPVGMFGTFATICVVPADGPIRSLAGLIAKAKAAPGQVFFGYYSSSSQVPSALLKARAGIDIAGAAYRNITQIVPDLISGQIQFAFLDSLSAAPTLQSGRVRPIAVSSPQRLATMPDLPTVAETIPGFEVQGWIGLTAPAGTPAPVIARMNALIGEALADPGVAEALVRQGMAPRAMTVAALRDFIEADRGRWREWVRIAGIQPE